MSPNAGRKRKSEITLVNWPRPVNWPLVLVKAR
jgi:hypothetical protein